jgi:hypothetical protein
MTRLVREGMNCDLLTKKGRDFRAVPCKELGMNVTLSATSTWPTLIVALEGWDGIHHIIQQHNFARYRHYQSLRNSSPCFSPCRTYNKINTETKTTVSASSRVFPQPQSSYLAVTVVVTVTVICPAKAAVTGMTVRGSGVELGVANAGGEVESALPLSLCEWW